MCAAPVLLCMFFCIAPLACVRGAEAPNDEAQSRATTPALPVDLIGLLGGLSPETLATLVTQLQPILASNTTSTLPIAILEAIPVLTSAGIPLSTTLQLATLLSSPAVLNSLPAGVTLTDLLAMVTPALNGGSPPADPATPKITVGPVLTTKIAGSTGAVAGYPAVFVAASDQTAATLSWDFGDGTPAATGTTVGHTFDAPGTYAVTVTAAINGKSAGNSANITIDSLAGSTSDVDSDGDGFPNELETALGTDPLGSASTPFGNTPVVGASSFTISKMAVKLSFSASNADSISIGGALPLPAGFQIANQTFDFDIGGVVTAIKLDANGKAPTGNNQFKLQVKKVSTTAQNAKFTLKLSKGSFASLLTDEGLTNAKAKSAPKTIPVIVLFNKQFFKVNQKQFYTSTGKAGATR